MFKIFFIYKIYTNSKTYKKKKFWDLSSVKCIETLKGHHDNVGALCLLDGLLYSASADASIKVNKN